MTLQIKNLTAAVSFRALVVSASAGFLGLLGGAQAVLAADVHCTAKVALNQMYTVDIQEETGNTSISNLGGTKVDGVANRYLSGRTGDVTWFLATGFDKGFEVSVEHGGQQRVAFCLAANECYLCR